MSGCNLAGSSSRLGALLETGAVSELVPLWPQPIAATHVAAVKMAKRTGVALDMNRPWVSGSDGNSIVALAFKDRPLEPAVRR
jgi:hypothetical protein